MRLFFQTIMVRYIIKSFSFILQQTFHKYYKTYIFIDFNLPYILLFHQNRYLDWENLVLQIITKIQKTNNLRAAYYTCIVIDWKSSTFIFLSDDLITFCRKFLGSEGGRERGFSVFRSGRRRRWRLVLSAPRRWESQLKLKINVHR